MPYISTCLCSFELGLEKPDPAIFKLALDHAGCAASQAVIIGDRLDNDIRTARLLGWKTIRVLQGFARFQSRGTCGMSQIYLAACEDAHRLSTLISFFILRQTSSTSATGGVLPARNIAACTKGPG
jgi:FMN phosphatase YigB (HAD superfamily)